MPSPVTSRSRLIPIVLGQSIGFGCGVVGVKLNSHLVPPAELGVYGVFLTFVPIGTWVVYAGLVKFVARHWAGSVRRAAFARELLAAWTRRLPWLIAAAAIATFAMTRLVPLNRGALGLALFGASAFLTLGSLAQTALQAEQAHWRDCAVGAAGSLSRTLLPPLFFLASGGGVLALCTGLCVHAAVTAGAGVGALRRDWNQPVPSAADRVLTSVYEGPLFVVLAGATWLLAGVNRWVVAGFFGDLAAGYFTLAGGIAVVVTSLPGTALMQYFQPGFFALGDAGENNRLARQVDRAALLYSLASAAALGGLVFLAPRLVGGLINANYLAALGWLLPAGCFGIATITAVYYHTLLIAGHRERACGPVDLSTAAVLVGGSLLAATAGPLWFSRWLIVTPLVPWLLTRSLARHFLFKPAASPTPAPAP